MRLLSVITLAFALITALVRSAVAEDIASKTGVRSLRTEFICKVSIPAIPRDARTVTLWIPLPSDSEWQRIESVQIEGLPGARITREPGFGNRMVYVHLDRPQAPINGTVRF